MAITFTPISPAFGAEVRGVELAGIGDRKFAELYGLWQRHHVVVLRDQRLTNGQFERFAAMLGELESPWEDDGGLHWHTDEPHLERPPFATLMRAPTAPAGAGETWFASMPAALRTMPADLVRRIGRMAIRHEGTDDPLQPGGAVHPIVIVQPETGEHTLYLGRRRDAYIPGLPEVESDRLLNIIWSYATAEAVSLCHHWRAGDVVLANNLTTLHKRDATALQRVQIKGRYTLATPIRQEAVEVA